MTRKQYEKRKRRVKRIFEYLTATELLRGFVYKVTKGTV